jgi:NAD(P)-dependent dehydrogenase (short-subunit alcohol dehydrogenase family)
MTSAGKVVLVTGANRGLGLAILQVAGLQDPSATFILTCRDVESGRKAAAQLTEEGVRAQIDVVQLDVTDDEQILEAVKYVTVKYKKLDGESLSK